MQLNQLYRFNGALYRAAQLEPSEFQTVHRTRRKRRKPQQAAQTHQAYIRQDLSWLKSYLDMTPRQELLELTVDFPETAAWVIWQDVGAYRDEYGEDVAQEIYDQDWDQQDAEDPDVLTHYIEWFPDSTIERLNKDIGREVQNEHRGDAPSFLFFGQPELVRNQWLIHFTNTPYEVQQEGFTVGTHDLEHLGLTVFTPKSQKGGGYNFAYSVEDFLQNESSYGWRKYGAHAVMFRASGLQMWHHGDKENQVIFWGADTTDRVVLWHQDKWCTVPCVGGANLPFCHEDLPTMIQWVMDNFQQYRKVLTCGD